MNKIIFGSKAKVVGFLSVFASLMLAMIITNGNIYATYEETSGIFTGEGDVRWEWKRIQDTDNADEPESVSIMFYDKPEAATTVVVPSLADTIAASGASSTLDTYYVRSADADSQATYASAYPKRTSTADVTVLDMTNTSKVQILGVKPIINPETEVELIFGENMVIGDGEGSLEPTIELFVTVDVCTEYEPVVAYWGDTYYKCVNFEEREFSNFTDNINARYFNQETYEWTDKYWSDLSPFEKKSYQPTSDDIGCRDYYWTMQPDYGVYSTYTSQCIVDWKTAQTRTVVTVDTGAFANYKLKLTNLENVKYLGWYAFQHATFNEASRDIIIKNNQTAGEGVFAYTNVTKATFENNEVYPAMFRGCQDLAEINFGNAETISYEAFMDTNLGQIDFSGTSVKNILGFAFKNAGLTSVNFDGVEKLGYEAFAYNNLTELYLPKSISQLDESRTFAENNNLTKLTIAYDTLTTGTLHPLHTVMGGDVHNDNNVIRRIKEIEIIAPYAENEEVKSTHLSYCDYHSPIGSPGDAEVDCHNMDSYKNILARSYFYGFSKVEKVTIGEGYEYIGSMAFYNYPVLSNSPNGGYHIANFDWDYNHTSLRKVILPETLKGVGFFALGNHCTKEGLDINLPQSIEYIDAFAFYVDVTLDTDVDLPNLKVLGTHAFFVSGVRNVHLYDKLEYIGHSPFQSSYRLNDVIIDFDVFNPDKNTSNLLTEAAFASAMFGHIQAVYPLEGVSDELKAIIGNLVPTAAYGEHIHKLGNIIFTEKVQTAPRHGWWTFYGTAAAKLDLSKTGWKVIPAYSFCNTAFDELLLPEGTTEIGYGAFVRSRIEEEVVIPETVKTIAANAFDNRAYHDFNNAYWDGEHVYVNGEIDDTFDCKFGIYQGTACTFSHGVKITSLPTGIESIGRDAFSYDNRFTADVNLPNITTLEDNAFTGTSTKNITLGSNLQSIGRRVFTGIGQIDNLTIDCDIASIYHGYTFNFMTDLFNEDVEHGMGNWYYTDIDDMSDIRQNEAKVRIGKLTIGNHATTVPDLGTISMPYYRILEPVEGAEMDEYGYCVDQTYYYNNNKCYRTIEEHQWENVATSLFYGVIADEIDMSAAQWTTLPERAFHSVKAGTLKLPATLTIIPKNAFYDAEIENLTIPDSVTAIDKEAFEYAEIDSFVGLPEGVTTIGEAAFYGASLGGNFVVPTTVNSIGLSAFNAGDADAHYDTVTIKPALDYEKTNNQAVFQMFWNATIDKLVIESSMLPVLGTLQDTPILPDEIEVNGEMVSPLRDDGEPEFHAMTMKEVVIKNLPVITANAFEDCANLEKVDLSGHDNLQEIAGYAFNNDTKLKKFVFGDGLKGKNVDLKTFAFSNTAIETIGREDSDFDLSAANFNAVRISVFSNMPKLKSVDVPSTFSINPALANAELHTNGSTIPASTFADDPELEEVTLDYQLSKVADGAFLGDDKITKLFVWGNTEIEETDDFKNATGNTTIPQVTNIFAYSDAPAENYANADSRSNYEGKFYPLDEVLYLTTNKIYVILEQDEEGNNVDFNKEGLILYALRRDGVILESDNWQEYTMAFPRATNPSIRFEQGRGGNLGTDENLIWNVYDAKKPFETISLTNENYAETSFEFMQMPSSNNPMVLIHYPDGYTGNVRTATLASMTKEEEQKRDEELNVPNTGVFHTVSGVVVASFSISAFVILGTMLIVKKAKK